MSVPMLTGGFIRFPRRIFEHTAWTNSPAAWFRVYAACCHLASFKEATWFDGRANIPIGVGQFITSRAALASFCRVSEKEVRTALNGLAAAGFIALEPSKRHWTKVSVTDLLPDSIRAKEGPSMGIEKGQAKGQAEGQSTATINNRESYSYGGVIDVEVQAEGQAEADKRAKQGLKKGHILISNNEEVRMKKEEGAHGRGDSPPPPPPIPSSASTEAEVRAVFYEAAQAWPPSKRGKTHFGLIAWSKAAAAFPEGAAAWCDKVRAVAAVHAAAYTACLEDDSRTDVPTLENWITDGDWQLPPPTTSARAYQRFGKVINSFKDQDAEAERLRAVAVKPTPKPTPAATKPEVRQVNCWRCYDDKVVPREGITFEELEAGKGMEECPACSNVVPMQSPVVTPEPPRKSTATGGDGEMRSLAELLKGKAI